ncbi:protein asteroid homolog 1-like isoform X2 [Anneissia japonica]|nr:protein asteroid homolog 1-like isoform X2 [Anneissia japonica]XP_033104726.1 protein asteroid homolog 1-like isoform X2 [Anneissia japonica]
MGVKGLTKFIDEHRFLSARVEISDTKLVIDGYSLLYHLYITAELDMKHGGENLIFYGICQTFITNLRQCGIEPFILIDGGIDTDEKKFRTLKDRHKDRIRQAISLAGGGCGIILPLLAVDVFRQVLMDHQVNFAQCDFEADSELSALANAYNCPLVSNDSDFYVTDLTGGFIHLKYFHFENPKYKSKLRSAYLECKIYHVDEFCKHFTINKSFLPLLGTLQGNDYVERFLGKHLEELIHWLAQFDTTENAVKAAVKYRHQKEILKEKIQASMEMYTANRTSEYAKYFQTKEIDQNDCQLWQYHDLPLWFISDFRDGLLTADTLNAFFIKKCFLANFIECPHHASSNAISLPIRKKMYGFIHQNDCSNKPVIEEYDREGSTATCRSVFPSYCSLSIHNIRSLNQAQSKSELLDCILLEAKDLKDIKEEYQLPIASMMYWIKNAKPEVCWRHIIALLLGIIISTAIKKLHEKQSTQCSQGKEDNRSMIEQRFTNIRIKFKATENCFDVDANHMFSQWQSVLKHISQLNTFLSSPLMMLDVSVVYNGTFVHGVYNFLKTFQKPGKALEYVNQSHVLENIDFFELSSMYCNVVHSLDTRYKIGGDVEGSKGSISGERASGYDRREVGSGNRNRRSRSSNSRFNKRSESVDQWSPAVNRGHEGGIRRPAGGGPESPNRVLGGGGGGCIFYNIGNIFYNIGNQGSRGAADNKREGRYRDHGRGNRGSGRCNFGSAAGNKGSGSGERFEGGNSGAMGGGRGSGGGGRGSGGGGRGSGGGGRGSGGGGRGSGGGGRGSGGGGRGSGGGNKGSGSGERFEGGNSGAMGGGRGSGGGGRGSGGGGRGSGGGGRGSGGGGRRSGGGGRGSGGRGR